MALLLLGMTFVMSLLLRAYWYGEMPENPTMLLLLNVAVYFLIPFVILNLWKVKKRLLLKILFLFVFSVSFFAIELQRMEALLVESDALRQAVVFAGNFLSTHPEKSVDDLPGDKVDLALLRKYHFKLVSDSAGEAVEVILPDFFRGSLLARHDLAEFQNNQ